MIILKSVYKCTLYFFVTNFPEMCAFFFFKIEKWLTSCSASVACILKSSLYAYTQTHARTERERKKCFRKHRIWKAAQSYENKNNSTFLIFSSSLQNKSAYFSLPQHASVYSGRDGGRNSEGWEMIESLYLCVCVGWEWTTTIVWWWRCSCEGNDLSVFLCHFIKPLNF